MSKNIEFNPLLDAGRSFQIQDVAGVARKVLALDNDPTNQRPVLPSSPRLMRYHFDASPSPIAVKLNGAGATTGTAGDVNQLHFPGLSLEYVIKGTQTTTAPIMTAVGLDLKMTGTNGQGIELRPSIVNTHKEIFTVGTSPAFVHRVKFKIQTVAGTASCAVGFRVYAADQTAFTSYSDFCSLNVNAGTIEMKTNLASGGVVTTSTTNTWADGETHELAVLVSASGVVSYQIDGKAPIVVAAVTMANATKLIPFHFFIHNATTAGRVEVITREVGFQADV